MPVRPLDDDLLRRLATRFGTPLYVYHTDIIGRRIADLRSFDVIRYAQKANSNLALLSWMRGQGVQVDAVSGWEVQRALRAGFSESEIVFTADLFDRYTLDLLKQHDIHVNLGSPDMLEQYASLRPSDGPGRNITLRINPGFGHGHDRKTTTGGRESKHGTWHEQLPAIIERAAGLDLAVTGIHMHIGSGSDFEHLSRVREAMVKAVMMAAETVNTFSVGGGLPVPYRPADRPFDVLRYCADWGATKADLESRLGHSLVMEVEPGRYLTAESGLLLAEVRGVKTSGGLDYILVDAGFDNLLRPAMYGAYHHISILGRDGEPTAPRVVAGPLCESADVFTQTKGGRIEPRDLPAAQVGDILCLHTTGAYGASMASNYNSRPLAAEVLVEGGQVRLVRERQTIEDLLALEVDRRENI